MPIAEQIKKWLTDSRDFYQNNGGKQRLAICEACPHLVRQPLLRCSKCGCLLQAKIHLFSTHCPIQKW